MYADPYAPRPQPTQESEEERRRRESVWAPIASTPPAPVVEDQEATANPVLLNAMTQPGPNAQAQQQGQGIDWAKLIQLFAGS